MADRNWIVEYATGSVANRHQLCDVKEWPSILQSKISTKQEIFRSMFLYDESIKDHVLETGSVSQFNGERYIDNIILDVDPQGNAQWKGDEARETVLKLIDAMNGKGIGNEIIQVWFSGRGFHVHIPNVYGFEPTPSLDRKVRASIARDFGKYVDLIYDATRLIRAGYSVNRKTGLYKVPLKIEEVANSTYDEIKFLAREIRTDYSHKPFDFDGEILKPADMSRANAPEIRKIFKGNKGQTSRFVTCGQHIYNDGEVKGKRHHNLLRLVSIAIRHYGYDTPAVHGIVKAYMEKFENPLPKTEVSRIVEDAYKAGGYAYQCNDEVLSRYCDPKCHLYKWRNLEETSDVLDAEDMINLLADYANIDFTDKSFDLKDVFPFMPQKYIFKAGDLAILTGNTKLGKTAFLQYIVSCIPSVKALYMSLEVEDRTIIRRFAQQVTLKTKDEIMSLMKTRDPLTTELIKDKMKHIKILTDSPDITKYNELIQEHKPKILIIDTVDMVPAKFASRDEFDKQEYIYKTLKNIAIKEDIIVFGVVHISKKAHYAMKEGDQMDVHMSKGSSAIGQKADKVIAIEPVGDNYEESKKRRIRTLASRDENGFTIVCDFDWNTFTFKKRSN